MHLQASHTWEFVFCNAPAVLRQLPQIMAWLLHEAQRVYGRLGTGRPDTLTQCLCVCARHGKNVNSDVWRQMQLWRGAGNPEHPFSRFHTGNHETLMSGPKVAAQPCSAHAGMQVAACHVMKLTIKPIHNHPCRQRVSVL
jgi:hypothetical protein